LESKALAVVDVHKTYRNGAVALRGVSVDVEPGEFFALLGPNGAGKSTLIGIVCSLVNKTNGKVFVFGKDMDVEPEAAKACIGIRAEKYLRQLRLWDKRHGRSRELSGGMKRRLMIARALVHEPSLLILDEPTAGVDIELRRSMWDFLRRLNAEGTTIILTTHYLEEAESLCESIAIIDDGTIIEDTNMKSLINQLHTETFILDLAEPIAAIPVAYGYILRMIDPTTLEVDISKEQGINRLFAALSEQEIRVTSLRNKANRLEELFLRMTGSAERESKENEQNVAASEHEVDAR
jgi:ABC-2 type transport system ATP-binding protein